MNVQRNPWRGLILTVLGVFGLAVPAHADAGVPMLALTWPGMFLVLLPVIVVEAGYVAWRLSRPFRRVLKPVSSANLFSTVVGVPLAWLLMFVLELVCLGASGGASPKPSLVTVILQAAWLAPYEENLAWMIPAAALILLFPTYLLSCWLERWDLRRHLADVAVPTITRCVWQANALSYGGLLLILLIKLSVVLR